jgi:hypothetical protein
MAGFAVWPAMHRHNSGAKHVETGLDRNGNAAGTIYFVALKRLVIGRTPKFAFSAPTNMAMLARFGRVDLRRNPALALVWSE